jgi:glycosyltransferase involved in cell wall biosynthesis
MRYVESQQHVMYCHTPTHFYWRHYDAYLSQPGFGALDPLARFGLKLLVKPLRKRDYEAAQRPDRIIANSTHIQADIKKYYGRDSTVIFPPVDVERFTSPAPSDKPREGFLTVSRLVPMKRIDIIIQACAQLDSPLTIIGRGPELHNLQTLAGSNVTFITNASDEEVTHHMQTAEAFLFAAHEDFGITPIEAMAAGTPVIAYKAGGALDYVEPGVTGEFFEEQTAESLAHVLQDFNASHYDAATIQQQTKQFSVQEFHNKMNSFLRSL